MKSAVGLKRRHCDVRDVVAVATLTFLLGASGCSDSPDANGARRVAERIIGGQRVTTTNQVGAIGYAEAPAGAEADPDNPDLIATFKGTGVLLDSNVVLTAAHVADTKNDENLVFLESDGQIIDAAWMQRKLLHPTFFLRSELMTLGLPWDPNEGLLVGVHEVGVDLAVVFLKTPITPPSGTVLPRAIEPAPGQLVGQSGALSMYSYMHNTDKGLLNRGQLTPRREAEITSFPLGRDHVVGRLFASTMTSSSMDCQKGDSGSGLFVGSSGFNRTLASINFASNPAFPQVGNACLSVLLDDAPGLGNLSLDSWIDAAKRTGGRAHHAHVGRVVNVLIDEVIAARRGDRRDQLFYFQDGGQCVQHIEFGEGGRKRSVMPELDLRCPSDATSAIFGDFSGGVGDEGAFLVDGSLIALAHLDDDDPKVVDLGGNYMGMIASQLNNDPYSDLVLDAAAGPVTFYGSVDGLVGPYTQGTSETCWVESRVLESACGGQSLGGDCACDTECSGRGDCCDDYTAVCKPGGQLTLDPLITAVQADPDPPVEQASRLQALATVSGPSANGLGVFLDRTWLLTAKELVEDATGIGDIQVLHRGNSVAIDQILLSPEGRVALLRVAPWVDLQGLPEKHELELYSGTPDELAKETLSHYYDGDALEANVRVFGPGSSLIVGSPGSRVDKTHVLVDARITSVEPPADEPSAVKLGAPVLTPMGQLVGIAVGSESLKTTWREGGEFVERRVYVSEQASFANTSRASDLSKSDRNWVRQVRNSTAAMSPDGSTASSALWAVDISVDPSSGQPRNAVARFALEQMELDDPMLELGSISEPGDWRFIGVATLGARVRATVWYERVLGQIAIRRLDGNNAVSPPLSIFVGPFWRPASVVDIDGDGVDDFIFQNADLGLHYFWLLDDLGKEEPTRIIKGGGWFSGPSQTTDGGRLTLVAASHFHIPSNANGVRTFSEQVAADTVWRADTGELWIAEMAWRSTPCKALSDQLVLSTCEGPESTVFTYDITSDLFAVAAPAAHWQVGGVLDLNGDGRTDIVLHARGDDAPLEERGRLVALLSPQAGGRWTAWPVPSFSGGAALIDPTTYRLAGGGTDE